MSGLKSSESFLRKCIERAFSRPTAWLAVAAAALLEGAFALGSPWAASLALDVAIPNSASYLLGVLAALLLVLAAQGAWATRLHQRIALSLSQRIEAECLTDLVAAQLASSYAELRHANFGDTSETLAAASTIATGVIRLTVDVITHFSTGASSLLLLAYYDPMLALLTAALATVSAGFSALLARREGRLTGQVIAASGARQQMLHVLLGGLPTLRAFGATERLSLRWAELARAQALAGMQRDTAQVNRDVLTQAGRHLGTWLATLWLIERTIDHGLTLGALITSTLLVANFLRSAVELTQSAMTFAAASVQHSRVDALVGGTRPITNAGRRTRAASPAEGLVLNDVWFRYAATGPWVLSGEKMQFPAGQLSVLRAASGRGKTTILRLLSGLMQPEHGTVSVFGQDPCQTPGLLAYLPQQSALLEGTIASNLTTLSGASLTHALAVARLTGLSELLEDLPMGVHTIVSPAGGNLSAGQRQLLLLTAVFSNPAQVVLLDEATSQLDGASLERIQWPELTRDRTVVAVRHE